MTNIRRWYYTDSTSPFPFVVDNLVILCIGTDRSTGDSLGPFIGSRLKELGLPRVYGCINDPVHALNLDSALEEINKLYPEHLVLAIDASLGKIKDIGYISLREGPLYPGTGVGKELPSAGEYHIAGVVNVSAEGNMAHTILQNTRLSLVTQMANSIVDFILDSLTSPVFLKETAVTEVE